MKTGEALSTGLAGKVIFSLLFLENQRLTNFPEQAKANERHLGRDEGSGWVKPTAGRPAMLGAANVISFHKQGMPAWPGESAYATRHMVS